MRSTKSWTTAVVLAIALGLAPAASAKDPKTPSETVRFAAGATSAKRNGTVRSYGEREYIVGATAGQIMTVKLDSKSTFAYFNVLDPTTGDAVETDPAPREVTEWTGVLPKNGAYRIVVYLVRAEARRGGSATYALTVSISK